MTARKKPGCRRYTAGCSSTDADMKTGCHLFCVGFSLFLSVGIGLLARSAQVNGICIVAKGDGSVRLCQGASAYSVAGLAAFVAGDSLTVLLPSVQQESIRSHEGCER